MEAIRAWFAQLEYEILLMWLITGASCLLCISFHEMCHGLAALALGDPTAKWAGRVSMNPLRHIDAVGLILMVTVRFGWAKGVPVDMRRFKKPKLGMALTALAGPVSNLVLAALTLMLDAVVNFYYQLYGGEALYYADVFLQHTVSLSIGLAVFNLLPVPPLDGSKILFSLLPDKHYLNLMRYERYGTLILVLLLVTKVLNGPLVAARAWVFDALCMFCLWPFDVLVSIYF